MMRKFLLLFAILIGSSLLFAQNQSQEELLKEKENVVVPPSKGVLATGDDCTDPIVITAGVSPYVYTDLAQTTCGRGNNYSNSDLGSYDGGEDIIYTLVLTEESEVSIEMDPNGTTWTGLGLFSDCPTGGNYIATATGSGSTLRNVNQTLAAGTYYIMVDIWPNPTCIPSFDLTVSTTAVPPPPTVPLSNWAFALIGLLAVGFVFVKFRK